MCEKHKGFYEEGRSNSMICFYTQTNKHIQIKIPMQVLEVE